MKIPAITLSAFLGLVLSGCATRPPPMQPVWIATPHATVPKEQAIARCEYDLLQHRSNFDNLSVLAGAPILNEGGRQMYEKCMKAEGYRYGGMVSGQGGQP